MKHFSLKRLCALILSVLIVSAGILNPLSPSAAPAEAELPLPDLSNVSIRLMGPPINDELRRQLAEDLFVVLPGSDSFSSVYEMGAYSQVPLFVTVDAMLHLQHTLFSHLLNATEDLYLYGQLQGLSESLLTVLKKQFEHLKGSEFENAAAVNLAFISVGNALLNREFKLPAEVREIAEAELSLIREAGGISPTPLFMQFSEEMLYEDYSQYKPRGYYTRSAEMEDYFRAMMWYGRVSFSNKDELRNRCGLLMSLALAGDRRTRALWDRLYEVSALFAGEADDLSYRDFLPLIEEHYGKDAELRDLPGNGEAWKDFHEASQKMRGPRIYSEARELKTDEEEAAESIGFRLMGQRFSADQEIFGRLIYNEVGLNQKGEARALPDVLDVMAAFGSDRALELLREQGAEEFEDYPENMAGMRELYADSEDRPEADNLAAAWLDSLRPLLIDKSESEANVPAFMRSEKWARKDLETFAGSFTELKHDTILYAKQVMAEMGGFFEEKVDDRGYVQPEPRVFLKLTELARSSGQKLEEFEMLSEQDAALIEDVAELNERLGRIAEKELNGELPTEEEFDLIRAFGGNLENLIIRAAMKSGDTAPDGDKPAIVTDVAADPNSGEVLELALGNPGEIWVIVPLDGTLRLAFGAVYNFYQFRQPLNERLTDEEWRLRIGADLQFADDGSLIEPDPSLIPEKPSWTQDYRGERPDYETKGAAPPAHELLPAWAELGRGARASSDHTLRAGFGGGRASVFSGKGQLLWISPAEYIVQDLRFLDINRDRQEDLLLLCWKEGRYGTYRPFG